MFGVGMSDKQGDARISEWLRSMAAGNGGASLGAAVKPVGSQVKSVEPDASEPVPACELASSGGKGECMNVVLKYEKDERAPVKFQIHFPPRSHFARW